MAETDAGAREERILIVDDQPTNILLLERILQVGQYTNVRSTTDPRVASSLYCEYQPDLILLDLWMPHLDGFAVIEQLRALIPPETYLPILMLTADVTPETKRKALAAGVKDFLTKPFDPVEVLLRVRNLLETRRLHCQLQYQNQELEAKVRERTRDLELAQYEILERLARAAEYRDDATGLHTQRVGELSGRLAAAIGLPASQVDLIRRAAPLHDVGKIGIPDRILLKPGRLQADEFAVMQQHTLIGARILGGSRFPLLQVASEIALTHHESWDGSAYPHGLKGEAIPLSGRIVAVVDVFDALTHDRPYKPAWPVPAALDEIARRRGQKFDPAIADAFLRLMATDRELEDRRI